MSLFSFNFHVDNEEEQDSQPPAGAAGSCKPCLTEQDHRAPELSPTLPPQPASQLEELSIADAFPVCEDNVVATIESLSNPGGDKRIRYYCPEEVRLWARVNCPTPYLASEAGVSDLVSGVYEGGLQLWECSVDLAEWLLGPGGDSLMQMMRLDRSGVRVAELGCGGGLPALCCLRWYQPLSVTFQDFNSEVLRAWTMPNTQLNLPELPTPLCFLAGSWDSLVSAETTREAFDLVLSSETIYNPANYEQFHAALCHCLAPSGVVLLSAKMSYFGVGGSVSEFQEFLTKRAAFRHELVFRTEGAALVRVILKLTRLS